MQKIEDLSIRSQTGSASSPDPAGGDRDPLFGHSPPPPTSNPPSHDPLELTLTCSFYWWELGRGQILGSEEYLCKQHCSSECVGNPLNASVFWHFKEPSINIITIAKDKITIIGKNKQKTLGSSPLHSKMQICIFFDCHILPPKDGFQFNPLDKCQESCGPGNPQSK